MPMAPHGVMATCEVTAGHAHDSPVFREMHERIPWGSGHAILDAAYIARTNLDAIARSGRDPVICPRRTPGTRTATSWAQCSSDTATTPRSLAGHAAGADWSRPHSPSSGRGSARQRAQRLLPCGICMSYPHASATISSPRPFHPKEGAKPPSDAEHKPPTDTKSGSFRHRLPRSAIISASSHARAHQNVHKSEAENSELGSIE